MTHSLPSPDLESLRSALACIDLLTSRRPVGLPADVPELLLVKKAQLKIKMYQEPGHGRPHFHIDYGPQSHVASYALDTGDRLEGTLDRKYDTAVRSWAASNRAVLLKVWHALQAGCPAQSYVQSLPAIE